MKNYLLQFVLSLCFVAVSWTASDAQCDPDEEAPQLVCINGLTTFLDSTDVFITVWASDFVEEVTDNCDPNIELFIEPGGPSAGPPSSQSLIFGASGTYSVTIWANDNSGNWSNCTTSFILESYTGPTVNVSGIVFYDLNGNCLQDPGEEAVADQTIRVVSEVFVVGNPVEFFLLTDANGAYSINIPEFSYDQGAQITIELLNSPNSQSGCVTSINPELTDFDNGAMTYDFPINLVPDCHDLVVDVSSIFLRRCFSSEYIINYCNLGLEDAEDASVVVTFDDFLAVTNSTFPWTSVDGNTYTFDLGDVEAATCGSFKVTVEVSCDAVLGQTHCTEAQILPAPCVDPMYSGPSIQVDGRCDGEDVIFTLKNVGQEDMIESVNYIVIEDVIMLGEEQTVQLTQGDSTEVVLPANGSTYRLEVDQVPDHPGLSMPSAAIEVCGTDGSGNVSLGFITLFPQDDADPFVDIDCQQNVGAFDPNDKQAYPQGVGADNHIRPNTDLEYKIRFQNTGTDTAFTVIILDTLSGHLNASSVRVGASSHPYSFNLLEGNIMKFTFDDIMLPDSNVNEPASHGFVKFRISQMPDNQEGTEILNSAAIYFDFNEPVITNTVRRVIAEEVVVVQTQQIEVPGLSVKAIPNPFSESSVIRIEGYDATGASFQLYHSSGRLVMERNMVNNQIQIERAHLPSGMYFYKIVSEGQKLATGKLLAR